MESHGAEVGHHARSVDLKQGRRTLRGLLLPLLNLVPFFCQMQYICSVNCRHQQLMVFHYVHLTLKPRGRLEDTATSHLSALLCQPWKGLSSTKPQLKPGLGLSI